MSKPTRKDAEIIIQLAELSSSMNAQAGSEVMWRDDFKSEGYPAGAPEHTAIMQLMRWFETTGMLYRNGLVNEDLLFDWLAITGTWDRLKPIALAIREHAGPAMWENFEYMAEKQRTWKPKRERKSAPAKVTVAKATPAKKAPAAEKVTAAKGANGTS